MCEPKRCAADQQRRNNWRVGQAQHTTCERANCVSHRSRSFMSFTSRWDHVFGVFVYTWVHVCSRLVKAASRPLFISCQTPCLWAFGSSVPVPYTTQRIVCAARARLRSLASRTCPASVVRSWKSSHTAHRDIRPCRVRASHLTYPLSGALPHNPAVDFPSGSSSALARSRHSVPGEIHGPLACSLG